MRLFLTALTLITMVVAGCRAAQPQPSPEPAPSPGTPPPQQAPAAADYFPYKPGVRAEYEGKGNEYASYKVDVLYQENNLVEWRRDSGGTVMAEVFKVEPGQVTLVYRQGEAYDKEKRLTRPPNAGQVILKGPVVKGTTWTSGDSTYTILSTSEQVQAMGQTLSDVVLVEQKSEHSTIRQYYHRKYGMVLSVFQSKEAADTVESRLKSVTGL